MSALSENKSLKNWLLLVILSYTAFIFNTTEFVPIGLLSDIARDFGMREANASILISVYAGFVAVMSLPLVIIIGRCDFRKILLFVIAGFMLSHFLSSVASNFTVLLISRLWVACSHAIFWSIVSPLAVHIAPKDKKETEAIRAFARKHGKKLVSIGFYFPWCDETVIPDPFEVLGYIRQADYVVTDTFHGSVMSLKFNRPFAAIVRSSNRQKMTSLLSQFRLDNRIVGNMEKLEDKLLMSSDYDFVNMELQKERIRSLDYLKANL